MKAFDDVEVTVEGHLTRLRTPHADQSALHGLLQRIQDLGIDVIEVHVE